MRSILGQIRSESRCGSKKFREIRSRSLLGKIKSGSGLKKLDLDQDSGKLNLVF